MQRLLVFSADGHEFSVDVIQRVFESEKGFHSVRFNEPGGALIEAQYSTGQDATIVRLNGDRETISLSGTSVAALQVAIVLQKRLKSPLRIIDSDYSFDLALSNFQTVEELQQAMATS